MSSGTSVVFLFSISVILYYLGFDFLKNSIGISIICFLNGSISFFIFLIEMKNFYNNNFKNKKSNKDEKISRTGDIK